MKELESKDDDPPYPWPKVAKVNNKKHPQYKKGLDCYWGNIKEKTPPWGFQALHVKDKLGRRRRRSKSSKEERKDLHATSIDISNEELFRNPNFRYERLWVPKVVSL